MADLPSDNIKQAADLAPRSRRVMRGLGLLLLLIAGLLAWYLVVFYYGWQSGQTVQEERRQADLVAQVNNQISLAQENIEQGSHTLAVRRLEWVLARAPDNAEALVLYQLAQSALAEALTPTMTAEPTPRPSPTPSPPTTPLPGAELEEELDRLRGLVENESWEEAVSGLIAFQWQYPGYERQESDELLYDAHIGLGMELVQGDQVELGLSHLELAEKLGDLPESVADYRTWAELYLQGIAFYNVNWAATTYYFRDLCLAAPFYQSSCQRLHEALVAFGNQYAISLDWCPAESLYAEAVQLSRSQPLVDKLSEARESCELATPTPTPALLDGAPITTTHAISAPGAMATQSAAAPKP